MTIEQIPEDRTLHDMVATGEIDAVMCPHRPAGLSDGSGRVRRLFPDYVQVEQDYYRRTGFFPIMHLTLIRRDLYEARSIDRYRARARLSPRPSASAGAACGELGSLARHAALAHP